MKTQTNCPTCGSKVTVSAEGETHFYVPEKTWIKTKDATPDKAQSVITCKDNGFISGMYFNGEDFYYGESNQTSQITHWMPLPQKP